MQVVASGFVNSAVMPNDYVQSGTGKDKRFANLLSGLVQPQNSSRDVEKVVTEDIGQLSNEEVTKLIQFLNSSDLSDIEFGFTLLGNLLSDGEMDITDLVKDSPQFNDENIVSAITVVLKEVNIDTEKENSSLSEKESSIIIEELSQMEADKAMAVFIGILPFINMDQTNLTINQKFADVAKSVKVFELLSNYENPTIDQQKIKGFFQKTIEKLEVLLKEDTSTSGSESLNKVFTPIIEELNQQIFKNVPTHSVIRDNQFSSAITQLNSSETEMNKQVILPSQVRVAESEIPQQPPPTLQAKGVEGEVAKQVLPTAQVRVAESEIPQQPPPTLQAKGVEGEVAKQVLPTAQVRVAESEIPQQPPPTPQVKGVEGEVAKQVLPTAQVRVAESEIPQQPPPTPQAKGVEGEEVAKQVIPASQVRIAESEIPQQPQPTPQAKGVEGEVAKQVLPTQLVKGIESEVAKQSLENQQVISHKNEISGQVETNKKIKLFANSLHPLQLASQHMNKNTNNPTKQNNSFDFLNGGILPFQQMLKTEQVTLVMNEPDKQVSTEKLIQQFESILSKSQFLKVGGTQKLSIKLHPEHLGALRIELIQKDSVLIAKMMTATSTAKDLLESQIQSLKHAFSSQNIQVEKIEISQQMNQQERFINRDSQPQQEQRQQREQEEQKQQHDSQFGASFEEALLNVEV